VRPISQGTPRCSDPCAARRARADRRPRRSGTAAGTAGLIGAIVAGGASARFHGEPKGLHRVGGTRIIDRVASTLSAVTPESILVANAPDAAMWLPGLRVVPDLRPERGSLVGIHTALAATTGDVLVVAWDMPFLSSDLLRHLVAASDSASAVFPAGPRGPEPFCAVYKHAVLPIIEDSITRGDLRLTALIERLPKPVTIPLSEVSRFGDPARLFYNVNTAEDLAEAERMARGE
jgi:molybdopterin-guanine dinucleotide biosynthesis protein A